MTRITIRRSDFDGPYLEDTSFQNTILTPLGIHPSRHPTITDVTLDVPSFKASTIAYEPHDADAIDESPSPDAPPSRVYNLLALEDLARRSFSTIMTLLNLAPPQADPKHLDLLLELARALRPSLDHKRAHDVNPSPVKSSSAVNEI